MQAWQWAVIAIPAVVLLVSIVMVARIASRLRHSSSDGEQGGGTPAAGRPQRRGPARRAASAPQRAASDEDDDPTGHADADHGATDSPDHADPDHADPDHTDQDHTDQVHTGTDDPRRPYDDGPSPQRVAGDDADLALDQSPRAEYARAERAITDDDPAYGSDLAHLDDQPAEEDSPAEALFRRPESR